MCFYLPPRKHTITPYKFKVIYQKDAEGTKIWWVGGASPRQIEKNACFAHGTDVMACQRPRVNFITGSARLAWGLRDLHAPASKALSFVRFEANNTC